MDEKQKILWIDGLKFIACMGVFWSHFLKVYVLGSEVGITEINHIVRSFFNIINVLVNGNFWVCVFCILSGYLACQKSANTFKELMIDLFIRYLRFVVPFAVMAIVVWLISISIKFPTSLYSELLKNPSLLEHYTNKINVIDICKCIFLFNPVLNSTMWMIQPLFLTNCIIYIYNFAVRKINNHSTNMILIVLFIIFGLAGRIQNNCMYCACVLLGCFISDKLFCKMNEKVRIIIFITSIILLSGGHDAIISIISGYINMPSILYLGPYWNMIYAFGILGLIYHTESIQNILEIRLFHKLNGLSFPIYIFHWPLITSVSLWIYGGLYNSGLSYTSIFILNFVSINIIVLTFSIMYNRTLGIWSTRFISGVKSKLLIYGT